jgi:phosphoribosylaminoimidazole-succinocarboxamide synthase
MTPPSTAGPARLAVPGAQPLFTGKVRDVYAVDDRHLLLVATDNLSAFDVVLPTAIPGKGHVLTRVSVFWFRTLASAAPHHLVSADVADFPEPFRSHADLLQDRSMLVRRAQRVDLECVVRARLTGSAYKDYLATGRMAGVALPAGLSNGAVLDPPVFTPSTKNDTGHDANITWDEAVRLVGRETAEACRARSLAIFGEARAVCATRGLELVDTKFEFGRVDGELTLIDEVLTSDSSRFWEAGPEGRPRAALDKQFVRDYLETLGWPKTYPGPELPPDIVARTQALYRDAERRLTGR